MYTIRKPSGKLKLRTLTLLERVALARERTAMPDADKSPAPELETVQLPVNLPVGFKPMAYLVVAIDDKGQPFTNAPPHSAVALRLANHAMNYAVQCSIVAARKQEGEKPKIVVAPAGSVPPFPGEHNGNGR